MGNLKRLLIGPGVRFLIVGGTLTLLDLALFQLFANVLHVSLFGVAPEVAAVWIGTPIVILINFFVSRKFVWHTDVPMSKTIVPFFGLNLFSGVLVQSLVVSLVVSLLAAVAPSVSNDVVRLLAKCVAVGVGMVINFFGAKVLFKWDGDE